LRRTLQIAGWLVVVQSILLGTYLFAVAEGTYATFAPPAAILAPIVAGLIALLASLVATWDPGSAARMYLWVAAVALLLTVPLIPLLGGPLTAAAVDSGIFIIPALFWWAAAKGSGFHHRVIRPGSFPADD
jgi:hypothetical protein